MKRLQRIEKDTNIIKYKLASNENEVLSLTEQKADLELELSSLKRSNQDQKHEYEDRFEEIYNQNARLNNQISVLLCDNNKLIKEIKELKDQNNHLKEKLKKIELLEEKNYAIQSTDGYLNSQFDSNNTRVNQVNQMNERATATADIFEKIKKLNLNASS